MLNIPDEVKALFSADVVHKNFHVHFPNGETSDLNNENIASESVVFTESLCSQQYFKFGLAEASQIEFTAVNIPNVRGAVIECAIEIDCGRLGSAWASAHPVDSSLSFLTPQPCNVDGSRYYRVPYGRFTVDTCPRDHGAMYRRQITAYSDSLSDSEKQASFELIKEATFITESTYSPNLYKLFAALCNNAAIFDGAEWTNTQKTPHTPSGGVSASVSKTVNVYLTGDADVHTLMVQAYVYQYAPNLDMDSVYTVATDRTVATEKSEIRNYILNDAGIDWETTLANSDFSTAKEFLDDLLMNRLFYPSVSYDLIDNGSQYVGVVRVDGCSMGDVIYPKIGNSKTKFRINQLRVPYGNYAVWLDYRPVGPSFDYRSSTILYQHDLNETSIFSGITMLFKSTLTQKIYYSILSKNMKSYSFTDSFSVVDYIKGQLELCGWFIKPARSGALDFFQMSSNPTAISISSSDWEEFWWDENPIAAIGTVTVKYTELNEKQQQTFEIGDGNSVYTIEDNEVLKSADLDTATVESILQTYFEPNASVINFTPADLSMRGLPFLETGDYIELTAKDGETVQTYILSQTISGIQNLAAEITSTTGSLLEVIDE